MNNPCWEYITEKEFKYWLVVVNKTHHTFTEYDTLIGDTKFFIEDAGLSKIPVLIKTENYNKVHYYKNINVIGGYDE